MSTQNDGNFGAQSAMGWLIAPLAILVALLADFGLDFGLGLEMNDLEPYAVIAIAAVLGMAPRVMKEFEIIHQGAAISLATLVVSLVLAEGVSMYMDSNFLGLIFFIVMFGGYLLDSNGRHEWNTVMIFGITGLWTAIVAAWSTNSCNRQGLVWLHQANRWCMEQSNASSTGRIGYLGSNSHCNHGLLQHAWRHGHSSNLV